VSWRRPPPVNARPAAADTTRTRGNQGEGEVVVASHLDDDHSIAEVAAAVLVDHPA
jgi:hypothetical protein